MLWTLQSMCQFRVQTPAQDSQNTVLPLLKDHPHERPHFFEDHFTESYRFIKKKKNSTSIFITVLQVQTIHDSNDNSIKPFPL